MPVKTTVDSVVNLTARILRRDLTAAAGSNTLLSAAEEKKASPLIREAAQAIRTAKGPGARVTVDALEDTLRTRALTLIGAVNQSHGPGAKALSKSEAEALTAKDALLGPTVLAAYKVVAGKGLDVDAIAAHRVGDGLDPDVVFKTFTNEHDAERYADPDGRHVAWLVPLGDDGLVKRFVSGRNDLWAQRFEIDRITGAITVTAEH